MQKFLHSQLVLSHYVMHTFQSQNTREKKVTHAKLLDYIISVSLAAP